MSGFVDIFKNLGIKTDLDAVTTYLNILLGEIRGPYKEEFLRNINTPIGPSANEKLNNMHAYDTMGSESSLEMSTGAQQAILSIELYLTIEQRLMVLPFLPLYNKNRKKTKRKMRLAWNLSISITR